MLFERKKTVVQYGFDGDQKHVMPEIKNGWVSLLSICGLIFSLFNRLFGLFFRELGKDYILTY